MFSRAATSSPLSCTGIWRTGARGCTIDFNWGYEHSLSPDGVAFDGGSNVRPELGGNFRE